MLENFRANVLKRTKSHRSHFTLFVLASSYLIFFFDQTFYLLVALLSALLNSCNPRLVKSQSVAFIYTISVNAASPDYTKKGGEGGEMAI